MKELCFAIDQLLADMGIPHWLDGGTLLGAVRENGHFLSWEDDVDMSFMLEDSINWDSFVAEVTDKLSQQGYTVRNPREYRPINVYYTPPTRWLFGLEQYRYRGEIKVDLIGNRVVDSYGQKVMERPLLKGAMPQVESGRYGVPVEMIMSTSEIELMGKMVSCPRDSDAYLQTLYGNYMEVDYTYVNNEVAHSRRSVDEASDR
jgi:phosphorylcholine metabolism protein LicD